MLLCFSWFSQYLNCFNSNFIPWIVARLRIWLSSQWHCSQPILMTRSRLGFLGSTKSQLQVKVSKNLRVALVWYKTMKNIILWGFWPLVNLGLTRGILIFFGWKRRFECSSVRTSYAIPLYMFLVTPLRENYIFGFFRVRHANDGGQNTVSTAITPITTKLVVIAMTFLVVSSLFSYSGLSCDMPC